MQIELKNMTQLENLSLRNSADGEPASHDPPQVLVRWGVSCVLHDLCVSCMISVTFPCAAGAQLKCKFFCGWPGLVGFQKSREALQGWLVSGVDCLLFLTDF